MNDVTTATTQPKTLAEKLVAAKALVAKLEQQINAENIKNDIEKGDSVSFLFGRGETRKTLTGTVAGFKDTEQGKVVAVLVTDEDGLPETKRVNIRDITANTSADARRAPVEPTVAVVSDAPADNAGILVADNADPLNAA